MTFGLVLMGAGMFLPATGFAQSDEGPACETGNSWRGKRVFMANCSRCHWKNLEHDYQGPKLLDLEQRYQEHDVPEYEVVNFILNSQSVLQSHDYFEEVYTMHYGALMPAMPHLTEQDACDILAYIKMYSEDYHQANDK